MAYSISDALSHYRAISDATHKFWGYFQAVAVGSAAFAWSREPSASWQLYAVLAVAFTVFASLNWRLVVQSQAAAFGAAECIRAYAERPEAGVPPELRRVIESINPDSARKVGVWHAGLSLAVLVAVGWHCLLNAGR